MERTASLPAGTGLFQAGYIPENDFNQIGPGRNLIDHFFRNERHGTPAFPADGSCSKAFKGIQPGCGLTPDGVIFRFAFGQQEQPFIRTNRIVRLTQITVMQDSQVQNRYRIIGSKSGAHLEEAQGQFRIPG